jgi:prevent-host-death family protein
MARSIAVSQFKAECLSLLEEVAATGGELVVTKGGVPVVPVLPYAQRPTLQGSVTYAVSDEELIAPIEESWNAERP